MSAGKASPATASSAGPAKSKLTFVKAETKVSSYDVLSGFLVATLLIVGFLTTILAMIWVTSTFNYDTPAGYELVEQAGEDGDDKPEGFEDDAFDPGVDDFPEVETPQLAQALEAVTDAVSSVKATLAKRTGDAAVSGAGGGYGSRQGGPSGSSDGTIPEYKRWKINYKAGDIETYKKQLSFWDIEIGVLRLDNDDVFRVSDPAGAAKVVKSNRNSEGESLYFSHIKPLMMRWDQTIARQAGVNTDDVNMIQFYSNKARQRIKEQEGKLLAADGRKAKEIRATIVKLADTGSGFDFIVDQINYK